MKIKPIILAAIMAVASFFAPAPARALECDQLGGAPTALGICLPRYGTDFDQWAQSDIAALTLINSSAAVINSTGAYNPLGWIAVNRISGLGTGTAGIRISSFSYYDSAAYVLMASSLTVSSHVFINGNVGIGTASPSSKLNLSVTTGDGLKFTNTSSSNKEWTLTPSGNDVFVSEVGVGQSMAFQAGGNVGIGTTAPGSKLDVNGSAVVRSTLTVGGNAFSVGASTLVVSNGRVGIGTSSPYSKLSVASSNSSDVPALGTCAGSLCLANSALTYGLQGGVLSSGNSWLQASRHDGTATAYNLILQPSGGFVGIGTSSPADPLGFVGIVDNNNATGAGYYARYNNSSTLYAFFGQDSASTYIYNKTAPLNFFINGASAGRWDATGLGIGKVPTTALDVNGTVTATQFVGGGAGLTGITTTVLVSTAISASSSTTLGTTLAADTTYEVSYMVTQNTSDGDHYIQFNHAGGTGCNSAIGYANSSAVTSARSDGVGTDKIYLSPGTDSADTTFSSSGSFRFRTAPSDNTIVNVYGIGVQMKGNTYPSNAVWGSGVCDYSSAVTSVQLLTSAGTLTGTYTIRQIAQ